MPEDVTMSYLSVTLSLCLDQEYFYKSLPFLQKNKKVMYSMNACIIVKLVLFSYTNFLRERKYMRLIKYSTDNFYVFQFISVVKER